MLNDEFLTGLLGNDEVSAEDKIKQIIAEHEADTRGLLQKRDELLGSEKKFKEQISAYEKGKEESSKKIADMEALLEKANAGDQKAKEYYETKLADAVAKYEAELKSVTDERDHYKQSHLKSLRDRAIEEGVKDLNFIPGLKDGFIARVLSLNEFTPEPIDGEVKFLNKEHHTIEEAISAFALSQEGKAYIANQSVGGGAKGSSSSSGSGGAKTMSRQQFTELQRSDPNKAAQFFRDGGRIV